MCPANLLLSAILALPLFPPRRLDEYQWTPPVAVGLAPPPASRRQSFHFPHLVRDQVLRNDVNYPPGTIPSSSNLAQDTACVLSTSGVCGAGPVASSRYETINAAANNLPTLNQGHVLTLPFGDTAPSALGSGSLSVGQLTLSQVRLWVGRGRFPSRPLPFNPSSPPSNATHAGLLRHLDCWS